MHNTLSTTIRRRNRRNANGSFGLGTTTPSYAWDFVNNKARFNSINYGALANTPGWSFSRASTGYAQTSAGVLVPFASGELRRTDKGVLIEGARTNLCLQSQTFDNASWTPTRASITANAVVAPDGTTTADKLTEDSTAGNSHKVNPTSNIGTVTATETLSVYAKAAERSMFALQLGANRYAYFNLSAGTIGTTSGSTTATITALANGWYRCAISGVRDTNQNNIILLATVDNLTSYDGDGTSGIYLWGAQLEAASFPSSYIPTTTASATRAADVLTVPVSGLAWPLSLYAEFERAVDTAAQEGLIALTAGITELYIDTNYRLGSYSNGASNGASVVTGAISVGAITKAAGRFATNDVLACRGGTLGSQDVVVSAVTPAGVQFGVEVGGVTSSFGYLRRAAIWSRALTDAELQAVTR